jgi:hypothetical protein
MKNKYSKEEGIFSITEKNIFDKSFIGKKFGTVIPMDDFQVKNKISRNGKMYSYTLIKCKCDCGNEKYLERTHILFSKYPSCGCLSNGSINLIGQRFGKLLVVEQALSRNGRKSWYCKCDCGSDKIVSTKLLRLNQTSSCGCAHHPQGTKSKNWKGTENISSTLLTKIKLSSKLRNLDFDLDLTYLEELFLLQNKKCALSGLNLIFSKVNKNKFGVGNASLDRIDSNIGYIKGNVQWVHKKINIMKNVYTQDEFIKMCSYVHKTNLKNKKNKYEK